MNSKTKPWIVGLIMILLTFSNEVTPIYSQSNSPLSQVTWQPVYYPVLPPPRYGSSITLNPINKVILMFGGNSSYPNWNMNDLWMTNGRQWMEFMTPNSPPGRISASMVYDEERQVAVLFGGYANNPKSTLYFNDTWIFNGVDWLLQEALTPAPMPREGASMVYDPEQKETFLFGGGYTTEKEAFKLNDMWVRDTSGWQEISLTSKPKPRSDAPMVYDQAHHNMLLFGGNTIAAPLQDTWIWDGNGWTEQHPLHSPTFSFHSPTMAYDPIRKQVIMVGQHYAASPEDVDHTETWAWDGQDWTEWLPAQPLPEDKIGDGRLVYVPELQTVVMISYVVIKPDDPDQPAYREWEIWALLDQKVIFLPIVSR